MLNNKAHQKLSTAKPEIRKSASKIITALITSKNNPRLRMVIGIVRIISSGLTITFKTDSITATIIAVRKLSTATPPKI